jgi:hypothetical protein
MNSNSILLCGWQGQCKLLTNKTTNKKLEVLWRFAERYRWQASSYKSRITIASVGAGLPAMAHSGAPMHLPA